MLAMQKVEGSSAFSRSKKAPLTRGFLRAWLGRRKRARRISGRGINEGVNEGRRSSRDRALARSHDADRHVSAALRFVRASTPPASAGQALLLGDDKSDADLAESICLLAAGYRASS
jgi:hypothetical protein